MVDRIPKPDQVVAAASNVAQKMLYGGLADLRPMPRTLIDEGELREVYHYRPAASTQVQGDPVLLVTPLAAPLLLEVGEKVPHLGPLLFMAHRVDISSAL